MGMESVSSFTAITLWQSIHSPTLNTKQSITYYKTQHIFVMLSSDEFNATLCYWCPWLLASNKHSAVIQVYTQIYTHPLINVNCNARPVKPLAHSISCFQNTAVGITIYMVCIKNSFGFFFVIDNQSFSFFIIQSSFCKNVEKESMSMITFLIDYNDSQLR